MMKRKFGSRLWLFLAIAQAGVSVQAGTQVFRCIDSAGRVEFRQGHCPKGPEQSLTVVAPLVGWIKPSGASGSSQSSERQQAPTGEALAERPVENPGIQRRCWEGQQTLQRIRWQRRKGYSPSEGELLRQQQREETAFQRTFCENWE
ncbi:MAG: hypothetical protein GY703_04040 [Gammaproteobacteria bacterium]|nr:hypothetical protein [Gammaproteobacteria bacterium]